MNHKIKTVALLAALMLNGCQIPITPNAGGPKEKTIKKGKSGDGFDGFEIWKGNEMNLKIKFHKNVWYDYGAKFYGDKPLMKCGGLGELGAFYYHDKASARNGFCPASSKDSISVGSFVHNGERFVPFFHFAFNVKTEDWYTVRIVLSGDKYLYTFKYKEKVVNIEEPAGKRFIGYVLGLYGAGENYSAPQDMTATIIYSSKEFL